MTPHLPRRAGALRVLGILCAVSCAALGLHGGAARACLNETLEELDDLRPRVARAKKALEQGRYLEASRAAHAVLPDLRVRAAHYTDARPLLRRARLVAIAATIRSNGRVVGKTTVDDESARIARLLDAYQQLLSLRAPRTETEQLEAEVMARSANLRDEARTRLEALAQKDVIASPEGWAALAALRSHTGDLAGAAAAKERCAARAVDERQCAGFRVEAPGRS